MTLKFPGMTGSAFAVMPCLAFLGGCDVPPPDNSIFVNAPAGTMLSRQGMAPEVARLQVAQAFAQAGCKMHMDEYIDLLDQLGYDPDIADITSDQGHSLMIDRAILEATPMLLADTGEFDRSGKTLTSHIGGCA